MSPETTALTVMMDLPIEIWTTTVCYAQGPVLGPFLQELNNGNYEDLIEQLKKFRVNINSFKSEVARQMITSYLHPLCYLLVEVKYKTKKETKIRKVLGTDEIVWIIISAQ